MTTWYIWGGLVRWSFFSATTDPPSSTAGGATGPAGWIEGGLVAIKFILDGGTSHRSLQVNWWHCGDIQAAPAEGIFRTPISGAQRRSPGLEGACAPRKTLVCENIDR